MVAAGARPATAIGRSSHVHTAGYNLSILQPHIVLDTHDRAMSDAAMAFLERYRDRFDTAGATITYERDDNFDEADIAADLDRLRAVFTPAAEEEGHDRIARVA